MSNLGTTTAAEFSGAVNGGPKLILRIEGLLVLVVATITYSRFGAGWTMFLLLFLLPDISIAAYLAGRSVGAAAYNVAHSYSIPIILLAFSTLNSQTLFFSYALIWLAHVGFDRALGYGLKYGTGFGDTHLGRAGLRKQR